MRWRSPQQNESPFPTANQVCIPECLGTCGVRNALPALSVISPNPPSRREVCIAKYVGTCGVCNAESRVPQGGTGVVRNGAELPCTPESPRCGVWRCLQCPRCGGVMFAGCWGSGDAKTPAAHLGWCVAGVGVKLLGRR